MKSHTIVLYWLKMALISSLLFIAPSGCFGNQTPQSLQEKHAGKMGKQAATSTYRILCTKPVSHGTGFLHKSGWIITASHVVNECLQENTFIVTPQDGLEPISSSTVNKVIDIAILKPHQPMKGTAIPISSESSLITGAQVSTWGFPAGYTGRRPLLSVGYISGTQYFNVQEGKKVKRMVINAAFNAGNSGGPLLDINTGTIIGVVVSKLAPLPQRVELELRALKNTKYGLGYTYTHPDGKKEKLMEGNVVADVLYYLRSQTQLVIGYSTMLSDLKQFLTDNGIEP